MNPFIVWLIWTGIGTVMALVLLKIFKIFVGLIIWLMIDREEMFGEVS